MAHFVCYHLSDRTKYDGHIYIYNKEAAVLADILATTTDIPTAAADIPAATADIPAATVYSRNPIGQYHVSAKIK